MNRHYFSLLFFIVMSFYSNKVLSSGAQNNFEATKFETSPYTACQKIKFLEQSTYDKDPNYWDKRCKERNESIQVLPSNSFWITKINDPLASKNFILKVAERSKEILDKKIMEKKLIQDCFNNSTKDGCQKILEKEISTAYDKIGPLRMELALSEGKNPKRVDVKRMSIYGGSLEFPKEEKELTNTSLAKSYFGTVGVFRPDDTPPMNAEEAKEVQKKMKAEVQKISEIPDSYTKSYDQLKEFEKNRAAHKARYLEILQAAPILIFLGKLPDRKDTNAVKAAFSKVNLDFIKEAEKEQAKMAASIRSAKTNPTLYSQTQSKQDSERTKELLNFMAYQPVVEQVIAEEINSNPRICSIATALYNTKESKDTRENVAIGSGLVAGTILASVFTGGLGLPGALGISAPTIVAGAGSVLAGGIFRAQTATDLKKDKEDAITGLVPTAQIDATEGAHIAGLLLAPADFIGFGLGKALVTKAAFKIVASEKGMSEATAKRLFATAAQTADKNAAKEAQTQINTIIKDRIKSIIPNPNPTKEELQALSALESMGTKNINEFFKTLDAAQVANLAEKKAVLIDAIKIFESSDDFKNKINLLKANIDQAIGDDAKKAAEEKLKMFEKELYKKVVAISRYGGETDPKRIAAILLTWDDEASKSLAKVYDEAFDIIKKPDFLLKNKNLNLKQRRELAFKTALKERNLSDNEANAMTACALGKNHLAINSINPKKIALLHVCVKDNKNVWFSNQIDPKRL